MGSNWSQQYCASSYDYESIRKISFVPNSDEINELIEKSFEAKNDLNNKKRSPLLSKLHFLDSSLNLLPETMNPDDTVLVNLAKKNGYIHNLEDDKFNVISDKNMTFGGGSCGPNGVLINCHDSFGKNRINLFGESRKSTREFVDAFLLFRNTFIKDFFNLFVEHLNKDVFIKDFKTDPTKNNVLDDFMQSHYINTVSLFNKVKKCIDENSVDIEDCGINVVSFCQSWIRNTHAVDNAQFSVCSPHFQTRFYIDDDESLKDCGVSNEEIKSYCIMIEYFDKLMENDYGVSGGGQAFINIDELQLII